MPEHAFWESDSQKARWKTAVVTSTGHVLSEKYQPNELEFEDVGLQVRVDMRTGKITPVQKEAAVLTFQAMSVKLLRELGHEQEEQIFKSGQVIAINRDDNVYYAMFIREKGEGLVVKRYNDTLRLVTSLISTSGIEVDEVPGYFGGKGLIMAILIEGYRNGVEEFVDLLAAEDQDELEQIALNVDDDNIADRAVQKIKDEKSLAKIVVYRKYGNKTLKEVISRINDQHLLCEVVLLKGGMAEPDALGTDRDVRICLEVLEKIHDQELFKQIFDKNANSVIRGNALERISDQQFLYEVVCCEGEKDKIREIAARILTDPELIKKEYQYLAELGGQSMIHRRLVSILASSITDIAFIRQIFDKEDDYVKEALIKNCTDKKFVAQAAKNKKLIDFVRAQAIGQLAEMKEFDPLIDIAKDNDEGIGMRYHAISSIDDRTVLSTLYDEIEDEKIREFIEHTIRRLR